MMPFARRSIRSKLVRFATGISVVAVLLVTLVTALYAYQSRKEALRDELSAIGSILSANLQAPLIFEDADAASETLSALGTLTFIDHARLLDASGSLVASYGAQHHHGEWPEDGEFETGDHLMLSQRISREGNNLGTLKLAARLDILDAAVRNILLLSGLVLVAAALVSWLMARLIGNALSKPIEHLAATMEKVSSEEDYTYRAERSTDDETGALIDGFNDMIDTIQRTLTELGEARDRAEAANRSKAHFLATMSHELRTPLNAIMGFSEVIRDRALGDRPELYSEYSADVYDSASYLLTLINDLLDMARLDAQTYKISEELAQTSKIINSSLKMVRPQADAKDIVLTATFSKPGYTVLIDDRGLRQVLINILGNAVKFTPKGGQIQLEERLNEDGSYAVLVRDNGPGIMQADLKRVLEPFEQASSSTSREHGGTGLGLSISAGIMKLHQGSLTVESTFGEGMTAILTLPAERVMKSATISTA